MNNPRSEYLDLELQEYGKDRDAITGKLNTAFKSKISKLKQTATRYDKKMRMKKVKPKKRKPKKQSDYRKKNKRGNR